MAEIQLESVTTAVGGRTILDDVSLTVSDGEVVAIMGPSGAGKTAVLRAIAGLDPVASGRIVIGGRDVTTAPTRERDITMVFAEPNLVPHATVRQNMEMALVARSVDRRESHLRVVAESRALGIENLLDRKPAQLSMGERQLVQIARALVRVPSVVLLDEPLSRLDLNAQLRLQTELRTLLDGYGATAVYVTKQAAEALAMAGSVAVMESGGVIQSGHLIDVRTHPRSRMVAEMTGPLGTFLATVEPDVTGAWLVAPGVRLRAWAPALRAYTGRQVVVGVRPEDLVIDAGGPVKARVVAPAFVGAALPAQIEVAGSRLPVRSTVDVVEGAELRIRLDRYLVFDSLGNLLAVAG